MGKTRNKLVSSGAGCRLFFIMPGVRQVDAGWVARRLLGMKQTKEVIVSEGDFGFIVKAAPSDFKDELEAFVEKNFDYRKVVCHYRYGKYG